MALEMAKVKKKRYEDDVHKSDPKNVYAQFFSWSRVEPTASSVLDQGEFDMISPAALVA